MKSIISPILIIFPSPLAASIIVPFNLKFLTTIEVSNSIEVNSTESNLESSAFSILIVTLAVLLLSNLVVVAEVILATAISFDLKVTSSGEFQSPLKSSDLAVIFWLK